MRIVSVVPSLTELLHYLELENEVVGITRFCIYPRIWFRNKKRIGGTKDLKIEMIKDLRPDLIIANKEENSKEDIETLMEAGIKVHLTDITTFEDALEAIFQIGVLTKRAEKAVELISKVKAGFIRLQLLRQGNEEKAIRVAYAIWRKPWMFAAEGTFIDEMLKVSGFENSLKGKTRYPALDLKEVKETNPDVIFLSSEPYPFKEKHFHEIREVIPEANIRLVDGELFSWYGSRMCYAPPYFIRLFESISL